MSATSSGRSFHLIASQLRTKQSSLNCPNHVWRTKSSIKKRIIVRQTIQSTFVIQTLAQLRTGLREREKKKVNEEWKEVSAEYPVCRQTAGRWWQNECLLHWTWRSTPPLVLTVQQNDPARDLTITRKERQLHPAAWPKPMLSGTWWCPSILDLLQQMVMSTQTRSTTANGDVHPY